MPKTRIDLPDYFAFRASASTAEGIREQAARERRTVSAVIREALQQRFPADVGEQSPGASAKRASLCTP